MPTCKIHQQVYHIGDYCPYCGIPQAMLEVSEPSPSVKEPSPEPCISATNHYKAVRKAERELLNKIEDKFKWSDKGKAFNDGWLRITEIDWQDIKTKVLKGKDTIRL